MKTVNAKHAISRSYRIRLTCKQISQLRVIVIANHAFGQVLRFDRIIGTRRTGN